MCARARTLTYVRAGAQLEGSQRGAAQLQADQAELHALLVKANERGARLEADGYQQAKRLEARIAELTFWQQAAQDKLRAGERESGALRAKVAELVRLTDRLAAGAPRRGVLAPLRRSLGGTDAKDGMASVCSLGSRHRRMLPRWVDDAFCSLFVAKGGPAELLQILHRLGSGTVDSLLLLCFCPVLRAQEVLCIGQMLVAMRGRALCVE